ncbi:hypothetical protein LZ30DRAFT_747707 [Colletotrichum cereale]|nr:hypothetical protein LZ30DRAFT_747707 [Colletotrichum cereale]
MAAGEFHLFPLLPGELRDLIWDHSVRPPGVRGVQYFSIFTAEEVPESFSHHVFPPLYKHQRGVIGAPMPENPGLPPSWSHNRSTYTIDGGLWTACKESRVAMHRRYENERWMAVCQCNSSDKYLGCIHWQKKYSNTPATFGVNIDGGPRYFTLLPKLDLLFIQGYPSHLNWNLSTCHMPFTPYLRLNGEFGHMATEFDPSWTIKELHEYQEEQRCPQGEWDEDRLKAYDELVLATKCRYDSDNPTLWLVDHRLRRKTTETRSPDQKFLGEVSEQMVFQGDGCKYYAVPSWGWDQLCEYDADTAGQKDFLAVWDFAQALLCVVAGMVAWPGASEVLDVGYYTPFHFLVCEKDD